MSGGQLHRSATLVLSLGMLAIGLALVVQALVAAGGVAVVRVIVGVLFLAAGGGRIYVLRRSGEGG